MRQAVRACYQRILKGEKILVEEVALRALEEPEDELTPLEALERSLNITIAAAACEAACEWATEQLESGLDPEAVLQVLTRRICID